MTNISHLNALNLRLSNERARLANAKTDQERQLRAVWVSQIEAEIASEKIGSYFDSFENEMTDDDLLRELTS